MPATRFLIALIISLTLSSIAAAQPHIRLNQLGFAPNAIKSALALSHDPLPSEFRVVTAGGAVVFKGQLNPITGSWGGFNHHA